MLEAMLEFHFLEFKLLLLVLYVTINNIINNLIGSKLIFFIFANGSCSQELLPFVLFSRA